MNFPYWLYFLVAVVLVLLVLYLVGIHVTVH